VLLILRDLFIAPRQIQHNRVLVVHIPVAEAVDLQPGLLEQRAPAGIEIVAGVGAISPEHHIFDAELLGKLKIGFAGLGRHLQRDMGTRRNIGHRCKLRR